MITSEKTFRNRPEITKLSESEQIFLYIINVGRYENYDESMDYIA